MDFLYMISLIEFLYETILNHLVNLHEIFQ